MSVQTRGATSTITGTVGTTPVTVLAGLKATSYLRVHNPQLNVGNFLAVTYDGVTTPVIFGAGITISPGGDDYYDVFLPQGPVTLVASAANTPFTLMWF